MERGRNVNFSTKKNTFSDQSIIRKLLREKRLLKGKKSVGEKITREEETFSTRVISPEAPSVQFSDGLCQNEGIGSFCSRGLNIQEYEDCFFTFWLIFAVFPMHFSFPLGPISHNSQINCLSSIYAL